MPGMYVHAKLEKVVDNSDITIPQQAVQRDLNGASVFLVGADKKVLVKSVVANREQGDQVIIDGLQMANRVRWSISSHGIRSPAAAHAAGTGTSVAVAASTAK